MKAAALEQRIAAEKFLQRARNVDMLEVTSERRQGNTPVREHTTFFHTSTPLRDFFDYLSHKFLLLVRTLFLFLWARLLLCLGIIDFVCTNFFLVSLALDVCSRCFAGWNYAIVRLLAYRAEPPERMLIGHCRLERTMRMGSDG